MEIAELDKFSFHDQSVNALLFDFCKKELRITFGLWNDDKELEVEKSLILSNVQNFKLSEFLGISLGDLEVYSHSASEENGINKIRFDFLADRSSQSIEMFAEFEYFSFF